VQRRLLAQLVEEPRLADAGVPADGHRLSTAGPGRREALA
jgi:hypothetical protein